MADPVTIFRGTTGLTTKRDPVRLENEEGIVELPQAVNVDVGDSRRVSRRKGFIKKSSTGGHSLTKECSPALFVSNGGYLCRLGGDFSVTPVTTLRNPHVRRMRFAQAPTGEIYFGNGSDKGVYIPETGTVEPWVSGFNEPNSKLEEINQLRTKYFNGLIDFAAYSRGAEELLRETEAFQNSPLPPQHLEFYRGRLYLSYGSFIIYSEPWIYSQFDLAEGYIPLDSNVNLIRRTKDGIFVGTQTGVFFLSGTGPDEFSFDRVSDDWPVEHTDVRIQAQDVTQEGQGDAAMFTSRKGICFIGPGGLIQDYTKDRIDLPVCSEGTGVVHRGAYYVSLAV